jgi:hypothetical protein
MEFQCGTELNGKIKFLANRISDDMNLLRFLIKHLYLFQITRPLQLTSYGLSQSNQAPFSNFIYCDVSLL